MSLVVKVLLENEAWQKFQVFFKKSNLTAFQIKYCVCHKENFYGHFQTANFYSSLKTERKKVIGSNKNVNTLASRV